MYICLLQVLLLIVLCLIVSACELSQISNPQLNEVASVQVSEGTYTHKFIFFIDLITYRVCNETLMPVCEVCWWAI